MNKKPIIYEDKLKSKTNKNYCYVTKIEDIKKEIDNIFNSLGPLYQKRVWIKTENKEQETYLLRKDENSITTFQKERIPIDDILSIKRIS